MAMQSNIPTQHAGGAVAAGTNVMAILSLVFAFVFAPAGIVFGAIAKKQIRQTGQQGAGLATAGFWLSIVFTVLAVISWGLLIGAAASQSTT